MRNMESFKRSRFDDARFEITRYLCEPYEKGSAPMPGYYWLYGLIPGPVMAHLYEILEDKPMCVSYMGVRTTLKLLWKNYPKALLFPIPLPDLTHIKTFSNMADPNSDSEALTPTRYE